LPDIGGVVPYLAQKVLNALIQLRNWLPSHRTRCVENKGYAALARIVLYRLSLEWIRIAHVVIKSGVSQARARQVS
jgi:hypothetical protein